MTKNFGDRSSLQDGGDDFVLTSRVRFQGIDFSGQALIC
jgi:hypothetical protein